MVAPQPFFQPRGTPFSVLHRLKALSRLGYQVDLLTYPIGQNVDIDGVRIIRIPRVPFIEKIAIGPSKSKIVLDLVMIFKTMQVLRKGNYDLIHSHEEAGFWAAFFSRRFGIAHLYDMHSSLPQQLSNFKSTKSKLIKKAFDALENYTVDSAVAVITICPELYNYVQAQQPDKPNWLIENVADNSLVFDREVDTAAIRSRVKTNGETAILYAGTFEPYQGIDLLIESSVAVVAKHPDARYVMVGGSPEQVRHYQDKARELQLQDHFVFTGSVPPEEVPFYVEHSDILVSPRLEGNNTPLKIYSYLRSGKPIVATDHLTHTQVLNSEVSVLTGCTADAFGAGVNSLLEDRQLGIEISKKAGLLADEKYSYDVYLKKTEEIYQFIEKQVLSK